jgi:serine/threonine protein kinase
VLDRYLADLQAGKQVDRAQLLQAHPELAGQLESCLSALEFIHQAGKTGEGQPAPLRLGDFRIVRELGRGGMGVVYEAEQLSLKRRVALKVLRFGSTEAEARERFQREAETVAALHHTNIVPIFAVGCEGGVHYLAMQLIEGTSLADLLRQVRADSAGSLPDPREVARWGVQAAEALAHAHARKVVHRDVKPSNLLRDPEGIVWLTDFGLARRLDEHTLTATGILLGTPQYMSPEQVAARQAVDERSDVYSLGATLYELATGQPVVEAGTPQEAFRKILEQEPVPPRQHRPDLPRDLETILLTCLAKEPAARYQAAQESADDLRRFVNGDAIRARRPSWLTLLRRWTSKQGHRVQMALLVGVVTLLLVWLGAVSWTSF